MSTRDPYKLGKTYRSTDEAFKGADYATPMWKCETEWDRTKEYLGWGLMWAVLLGVLYLMATYFEEFVA
jgi:hypothetical protein